MRLKDVESLLVFKALNGLSQQSYFILINCGAFLFQHIDILIAKMDFIKIHSTNWYTYKSCRIYAKESLNFYEIIIAAQINTLITSWLRALKKKHISSLVVIFRLWLASALSPLLSYLLFSVPWILAELCEKCTHVNFIISISWITSGGQ